ncbi:hypothetical protein [Micromonospora sp. NPDC005087]|uniref:hypothetical protein n=1 Tax=Micromonospora sp. NPDC005087 TaxID=3364225 RepID=UPI0036C38E3D
MTRNRRRKMEIRAQQASTGVPYLEAMRQTLSPTTAATPAPVSPQVELRPPLAAWRRPVYCRYWADRPHRPARRTDRADHQRR